MKLIKISSDHYIIVDDSEIKEKSRDLFYSFETGKVYDTLIHHTTVSCKKITHSTQPLGIIYGENGKETIAYGSIGYISLSEVKELLGEVDVEKMANEYADRQLKGMVDKSSKFECVNDFITGYSQSLEDNKDRKYTEKDMRKAYYKGATDCHDKCTERNWRGIELKVRVDSLIDLCSTYIQSLQLPTSWDVTFVDGKLKPI